ncbi:MAG: methionine synthase [Actinomycetota bacterium]
MNRILGACIGSCVHVAGILNFLNLANKYDYRTKFLGSACTVGKIKEGIKEFNPDIVAVSYRLSPESAMPVFKKLKKEIFEKQKGKMKFILGTTKPVAEVVNSLNMFDVIFTGEEGKETVTAYLKKGEARVSKEKPPQSLAERVEYKKPFPVLRHHFGRPTMEETVKGIKEIASSGIIDVVSIGPDQNTQEFFFEPEKMNPDQNGAGGVPVRSERDFKKLFEATRMGNYPIMRCYSGTNNIARMAKVLLNNINNAWCAVPLCWYNELDNRSQRKLVDAIRENQEVMKWHAQRGVPVEVNESHHWSLRYSPDSVAVAAAYLAAYNAKKMGVGNYVAQYMFNTPPETSFTMDLAKMLAKVELIESLHDSKFTSLRQTRTGLYSYPASYDEGKGQLASSTLLQMQLDPHIVHVVAYCESDHAAKPQDVIESTKIAVKAIKNYLNGCPDMKLDQKVQERKKQLVGDARLILQKIKELDRDDSFEDPLAAPEIISKAIKLGILDAPHLQGVEAASGKIRTMFVKGANFTIDGKGKVLAEKERLNLL